MEHSYLIGYVYSSEQVEQFLLKATPKNIASFIVNNSPLDVIQITTPMDTAYLSTRGGFIDYCADQEFLRNELLPVLIPMQLGNMEASEVELLQEDEVDQSEDNILSFNPGIV